MSTRSTSARIESAIGRLESEPNVWIATASMDGVPHLIPLSFAWVGSALVVATPTDSPTVRNARESGRARAALDSADDVVILDADAIIIDINDADNDLLTAYINQVGWDPRNESGSWSILTLSPHRVQAWNSVSEIEERTIMRRGAWLNG